MIKSSELVGSGFFLSDILFEEPSSPGIMMPNMMLPGKLTGSPEIMLRQPFIRKPGSPGLMLQTPFPDFYNQYSQIKF